MMKRLRSTFIGFALAAVLVAGVALPAQAASIGLTGAVTQIDPDNALSLDLTSPVFGTAFWTESLVPPPNALGESVLFDYEDSFMNLVITIGSVSYNFANDLLAYEQDIANYPVAPFLEFVFLDGALRNIFLTGFDAVNNLTLGIVYDYPGASNEFSLYAGNNFVAGGNIAPVPEPGTFLLLGAGLGGLVYVQRRRKQG